MSDLLQSNGPTTSVRWPAPETALVELGGEHDLETLAELRATLDPLVASCMHVIVDLSDATFIDSSTLGELMRAKRLADLGCIAFHVVAGADSVAARALEITTLSTQLNVVEAVDQAVAA
jgi:anti-sigma B factor antagonist